MTATPFRAGGASSAGMSSHDLEASTTVSTYLADASEFQPDIADAVYLAWSKAIVIRAAFGDAHDDRAWYGGARREALHKGGVRFLGIYQYLVAGQDGTAQANALHDLVGPLRPGEVLIADFEEGQHPMLTAWYNRQLALGYPERFLWTYTGESFGQANGALPVQWIAAYRPAEPSSPHVLWQFTANFEVPGIGMADCSIYHGTIQQLAALAYQDNGTTVTPPAPAKAPAPAGLSHSVKPGPSSVTFAWENEQGEPTYHFQVERFQQGFGWVLTHDDHVQAANGKVTACVVSLAQGQYRWRVAAGTSNYVWADWQAFDA